MDERLVDWWQVNKLLMVALGEKKFLNMQRMAQRRVSNAVGALKDFEVPRRELDPKPKRLEIRAGQLVGIRDTMFVHTLDGKTYRIKELVPIVLVEEGEPEPLKAERRIDGDPSIPSMSGTDEDNVKLQPGDLPPAKGPSEEGQGGT